MKDNYLFTPFRYIAGWKALAIGWLIMFLTAAIAYVGRTHFDGIIDVHAGMHAVVRWPRPGAGKVSYPPTMALLMEPPDAAAELRHAAVDSIHRGHF